MGKRKKIGIFYEYNENWIGGTYYIQNLIAALNQIDKKLQPWIYVFTPKDEDYNQLKTITRYELLKRGDYEMKQTAFQLLTNKISYKLFSKLLFSELNRQMDVVFPALQHRKFHRKQKFIYWIADFQEHYLPHFFNKEEIDFRKTYQSKIATKHDDIIFSSEAVLKDFKELYPAAVLRQHVLPFAVTHSPQQLSKDCLAKYNIATPYFICCNQFWKHKNHLVVLEAIRILAGKDREVKVVFTGKEHDKRNPGFFEELEVFVDKHGIAKNVAFLGFIERDEQLSLMQSSIAVIQPSLFEGWSTVIEDAKSLKSSIIASSLAVHHEQLQTYPAYRFFDPYDAASLASEMEAKLDIPAKQQVVYDYSIHIKKFGNGFLDICTSIIDDKNSVRHTMHDQ